VIKNDDLGHAGVVFFLKAALHTCHLSRYRVILSRYRVILSRYRVILSLSKDGPGIRMPAPATIVA